MSPGAPAHQPVIEYFGRRILTPDGQIDRKKLASVVFDNPDDLEALEQIVHPIVLPVIDLLIRRAKQPVVAVEAIKLIESGLADECDALWVVTASESVQIHRLMHVRQMTEVEARRRVEVQPPQAEKEARASTIIQNAGGYEETWSQVEEHWNALLGIAPTPPRPEVAIEPAVAEPPGGVIPPDAEVSVVRGGPGDAQTIADFISRMQGVALSRTDVIMRFGQKAYMLAQAVGQTVGLAGWQVENLVTRIDELYLAPDAPVETTINRLVDRIESASNDLQSEVSLLFIDEHSPQAWINVLQARGYEPRAVPEIRVPDWREAAEEAQPPGTRLMVRKLREDRVLRPV
jgi:dephospho-CoA kinase